MSLPRIVREASLAAVGAAQARTALDEVTAEAEALGADTAEASARLPQCRAAADAAHAVVVERAPGLLQVRCAHAMLPGSSRHCCFQATCCACHLLHMQLVGTRFLGNQEPKASLF